MISPGLLSLADMAGAGFGILFDTALKGSVLVGLAAIAAWLLRNRSAAARHAAWTAAVIGHLALPVLALVSPEWRISLLPRPTWLSERASARVSSITPSPTSSASRTETTSPSRSATPLARDDVRPSTGDARSATAAGSQRFSIDFKLSKAAIVALLWLAGALFVFARLAVGTMRVSRLAKSGERVDDGAWLSLTQRIANRLGIARPLTLLRGDRLGIPVTWGVVYPAVLLPPDADAWPEDRRRFVLVHEMAHVKRFDALTQLLAQITVAIFWFDPLIWVAAHRMRVEREHACDDYVLRDGTKPSLYAGELLEMVQSLGLPSHERAAPAFAALAMARRSEFEGRMLSILDPRLDRHTLGRRSALATAAVVALLALPLAALRPFSSANATAAVTKASIALVPKVSATPASSPAVKTSSSVYTCDTQPPRRGNVLTHIQIDDDDAERIVSNYLVTTETRCEEASLIGRAQFSNDERQILSLTPGSVAAFRERTLTHDRTVTVTRLANGSLAYTSTFNGRRSELDQSARQWLSTLLPRALAEMSVNVKTRVARVRTRSGLNGVLSMIHGLQSTAARRNHYDALMSSGLSAAELQRVIANARTDFSPGSSDLNAILRRGASLGAGRVRGVPSRTESGMFGPSLLGDPAIMREALWTISSDGDRVSLLSQYVQTEDPRILKIVLDGISQITSSGDKRAVLALAAPRVLGRQHRTLYTDFFSRVDDISSPGDKAAILIAALPYGHADQEVTIRVFKSARDLSSDGDKTTVLTTAAKQHLLTSDAVVNAYVNTARTISSSGDMRTAMEAVLKR